MIVFWIALYEASVRRFNATKGHDDDLYRLIAWLQDEVILPYWRAS